jgi:hypothetical protein
MLMSITAVRRSRAEPACQAAYSSVFIASGLLKRLIVLSTGQK